MGKELRNPDVHRRGAGPIAGFVGLALAAGLVGARYAPGAWYAELEKPFLEPPPWLFGVVWPALYVMMGVAAGLVWQKGQPVLPLLFWLLQLGLNAAWSWVFFGLQQPGLAFFEIRALRLSIAVTLVLFWRVRIAAGMLLVPYLFWVGFASWLNFQIWQLNC